MWLSVTLQSGEREAILRQLILNTAGAGADQTQPKAFLSFKLSNHHFSTSGPQCVASPALLGLCVCISATLFWAFMPHTISKPPLSPPFFLARSLCFLHTPAGFRYPMYYGWEKINRMRQPFIWHTCEITGQERLEWSNRASAADRKKLRWSRSYKSAPFFVTPPSACCLVTNYIKPPLPLLLRVY